MALIECPECGREVSDKAAVCPGCGFAVAEKAQENLKKEQELKQTVSNLDSKKEAEYENKTLEEKPTREAKFEKTKITKPAKVILLFLIIGVIIYGIYGLYFVPNSKYNGAIKLYNQGEYDDAYEIFKSLSFKDSETLANECLYESAIDLVNSGKYTLAKDKFSMIDGYKDSNEQITEINYIYALKLMDASPAKAKSLFEENLNYKDSADYILECDYKIAILEYNRGNINIAKTMFEDMPEYKEKNDYLENINVLLQIQGTWFSEGPSQTKLIISDTDLELVFVSGGQITDVFKRTVTVKDDIIYEMYAGLPTNVVYKLESKEKLLQGVKENDAEDSEFNFDGEKSEIWVRTSDIIRPLYVKDTSPKIGMTADEVRSSSWGSPQSINKTTTKFGVSEQWVYSGYKYIYLDNGIVTAIQE